MKLLIAGKFIQINDYVELVSESPLINNFDTNYATYSNSFEVKYSGEITDLIDVSKLRITASPYLLIEGHLIDGPIFIPVTILINSFDPNKNTIKINVSERFPSIASGGIDVRTTKLTELRHTVLAGKGEGFTDEIILADGSLDVGADGANYLGEASVLATNPSNYPHAITANNWCPLVSVLKLAVFLNDRYGILVEDAPDTNFFANRQLPFYNDVVRCEILALPASINDGSHTFYPAGLVDYPAGLSNVGLLLGATSKTVKYRNDIGRLDGRFITCAITVNAGITPNPDNFIVKFKTVEMVSYLTVGQTMYFEIPDTYSELSLVVASTGTIDRVVAFEVTNGAFVKYNFHASVKVNVDIPTNALQATALNSRQVFQNMPDVTIIDFFKTIAKASAKYLEITENGFKFVDIATSLAKESIVDASPYFIDVKGISYSLYDSPALEYWYKGAATATLIVPIADERVKSGVKKIEIAMLRTSDANVSLFESDAIKPLVGIATYPFLDITDQATELRVFYSAIQNPFVVTATFRNFNLNLSNSILIRQLNGLFVPKKIIKTNRDIIEMELLKLEPESTVQGLIITENSAFALICEEGTHYIAQEAL